MGYLPHGWTSSLQLGAECIIAIEPIILAETTLLMVASESRATLWSIGMVRIERQL